MSKRWTESASAARQQADRTPSGEANARLFWVSIGVPAAISLVSLGLSLYTLIEASREPEIWLSAPVWVRLSTSTAGFSPQGWGDHARFYVTPRLVSAARNDRVGVITDLGLEVVPPEGGAPISFVWSELGEWRNDPYAPNPFVWIVLGEPAPLVVGPSSPKLPTCAFVGPPNWQWQPGDYLVTIVASRGETATPLRAAFTMTVSADQVEWLLASPGHNWVFVETEVATPTPV
jgi:hypothetical protein